MSGFEVVGVVLAIWPLVVNGIQVYKLARSGQGWELLHDQFRTEEIIFVDCIQHLLASHLSESDLSQLTQRTKPNNALLKDPAINRALEARLGPQKSLMVLKTIQNMDSLLVVLSEKMQSHIIPSDAPHQKLRSGLRHIKLLQAKIKDDLNQLRTYNEQLQRLLFSSSAYSYQPQITLPEAPSSLPCDVLHRIASQANELHDVIGESYSCDCRHPHEASLGALSDQNLELKEPFELVFPVSEELSSEDVATDQASPNSLESQFDGMSFFSSRGWSHRGSIDTLPSSIAGPVSSPSPPLRSRAFSFSQDSGLENAGSIDDLCRFIKKLGDSTPVTTPASCLGVLGMKYTVKVTSVDGESSEPNLVCLDYYLSAAHKREVTRKKRMDLALSMSLAILQFYTTPWIDMWWTWKDFCVARGDKSQIFVTKSFYSTQNPMIAQSQPASHSLLATEFWAIVGEPILTRLGFALVELALGQRLCKLRQVSHVAVEEEDMLDLLTARQLVKDGVVRQEAGTCYHDAVQACLTHQVLVGTSFRSLTSEDVNFQRDVEKYVVAPIRDYFTNTWGQVNTM